MILTCDLDAILLPVFAMKKLTSTYNIQTYKQYTMFANHNNAVVNFSLGSF